MIPNLPTSTKLPIEHLAACFNNVTNSYKFYWLLAILNYIREKQVPLIPLDHLLAEMIAEVWYPTNYFLLSFGKQDRLSQIALKIKSESGLTADTKKGEVVNVALALSDEIATLGRFVPYRFLRPFFEKELKGKRDWEVDSSIIELAEKAFSNPENLCLYRFTTSPKGIEIQQDWFDYLQRHLHIMMGFCLWHLLNYVQKNNPNVPSIATKLFEPEKRDLKQAKTFWKLVFDQIGLIQCIYSGYPIHKNDFSLDHFLPWRFVTHDLLWNIIPTSRSVNSAKSDNLPNIDQYFISFARLQYDALQSAVAIGKPQLFEDYVLLFNTEKVEEVIQLPFDQFRTVLHDTIVPQIQIAKNMGFVADWSYSVL